MLWDALGCSGMGKLRRGGAHPAFPQWNASRRSSLALDATGIRAMRLRPAPAPAPAVRGETWDMGHVPALLLWGPSIPPWGLSLPLLHHPDGDAGSFNGSMEFCRTDPEPGQRVSVLGGHPVGNLHPAPPQCHCSFSIGWEWQPGPAAGTAGGKGGGGSIPAVPQFPHCGFPRIHCPVLSSHRKSTSGW